MKYIMAVVCVLIAATLIFIFRPPPQYEAGKAVSAPQITAPPVTQDENKEKKSPEDERRAAMQATYDELARSRRNLEVKLNKLKVVLWDLKLPREESDAITETMKNSYAMLKNPRMLGAYSGLEEISDELARVKYLYSELQQIEDKYRTEQAR